MIKKEDIPAKYEELKIKDDTVGLSPSEQNLFKVLQLSMLISAQERALNAEKLQHPGSNNG